MNSLLLPIETLTKMYFILFKCAAHVIMVTKSCDRVTLIDCDGQLHYRYLFVIDSNYRFLTQRKKRVVVSTAMLSDKLEHIVWDENIIVSSNDLVSAAVKFDWKIGAIDNKFPQR